MVYKKKKLGHDWLVKVIAGLFGIEIRCQVGIWPPKVITGLFEQLIQPKINILATNAHQRYLYMVNQMIPRESEGVGEIKSTEEDFIYVSIFDRSHKLWT